VLTRPSQKDTDLLKAGNLSVKCGDDLVCIHRANIAKQAIVTNTEERTEVTPQMCHEGSPREWRPGQLESAVAFGFVFGFAIGYSLPLHIVGSVGSSAFKRIDVVDHVARTAPCR
jgi:hypothetical protein